MNTPPAIGDFVRCSDGTPPPPAHHKKKLRHWQCNNFTGWIRSIEPGYGYGIDKTGTNVLVNIMRFGSYTFTKITPPSAQPETQLHPRLQPRIERTSDAVIQHKQSNSPWGKVDGYTPFGDLGLYHHSTPGHGGIYVPSEMKRKMPKPYRDANKYGGGCWFEEDSEWALVALSFPSGLDEKTMESARKTVKNWYPHAYMAVTGETLTREDSYQLAKEEDRAYAKDKYVCGCAWGHGNNSTHGRSDVPPGMVGVSATIGGRDDNGRCDASTERHFLIPEAEYSTRTSFGFIIEKDYPAWPMAGEEIQPLRPASRLMDPAAAKHLLESLVA